MDHHSTIDRSSASPAMAGEMPESIASPSGTTSVSAGIAAASAHFSQPAGPGARAAGEDARRTLAEIAGSDLDAALQLLAERAQFITASSGAAIALRRGEHNDMLCRASAGSNAPELGALLSMEYGLSGESVRTRQTLRCDDAEHDPRVNREGCRQLGIASVVVMPIVSDQQVLGVFELFSGKPRAFEERDISALQRLSEMVETAVKHAVAAQGAIAIGQPAPLRPQPPEEKTIAQIAPISPVATTNAGTAVAPPVSDTAPNNLPTVEVPEPTKAETQKSEQKTELEKSTPEPAPKKPLFWSAAMQTSPSASSADETAQVVVPPVLRNLQKCQACGFPVSQGRTFCVECEEKQWRGQQPRSPGKEPARPETPPPSSAADGATPVAPPASTPAPAIPAQISVPSISDIADPRAEAPTSVPPSMPVDAPASDNSTLFLSSATAPESWLKANKYIVGALLIVALVIAAIVWLR
jgi:hypothetical protein